MQNTLHQEPPYPQYPSTNHERQRTATARLDPIHEIDIHHEGLNTTGGANRVAPLKRKPVASRQLTSNHTHGLCESVFSSSSLARNLDEYSPDLASSLQDIQHTKTSSVTNGTRKNFPSLSPAITIHARNLSEPLSPSAACTSELAPSHKMSDTAAAPLQRSYSARPRLDISPPSNLNVYTSDAGRSQASSKISAFFGWRGGSNNAANAQTTTPISGSSPTTISSDRDTPEHSPYAGRSPITYATSVSIKSMPPPQIDVTKANAAAPSGSYFSAMASEGAPAPTPGMSSQIEELEEELRDLSAELAASIRREMELEDEVEQLQNGGERLGRRTSDYFSDSATSSVKDGPMGKGDVAIRDPEEELVRVRRKGDQEKAQMKLDLAQKLELERGRRKGLEQHVQRLEAHILELEQNGAPQGGNDRLQELERRLAEEREMKQNYEDLLHALKGDLTRHQNERDNLRDEVVPQLRARVDGLEAEAAQYQTLQYENTRMQQELAALRGSTMGTIAEGGVGVSKMGLSRSASTMRRSGGLSRSNSTKQSSREPLESRESLADRVKDIEEQRDALHRALKSLLARQTMQQREHEKRVAALEAERDKALEASSPRRRAYAAEVKELRFEINTLRSRAEDALEGKWQCEKNLAGLKTNLDRAEQETTSLRELLKKNDVLIPDLLPGQGGGSDATSATLERAYRELREAQSMSIAELRKAAGIDGETDAALDALLKALNETKAERDFAVSQSQQYKAQAESLNDVRSFQQTENASLSTQLEASAMRVAQINIQISRQLESNKSLRERLGDAVAKGEKEQRDNAARITTLQTRLRQLEDRLVAAQADSEDRVQENEDVVRSMSKNDNPRMKRLGRHSRSNSRSQLMPGMTTPLRSPRLLSQGMSLPEATRTEGLEMKVKELEKALSDADAEMQEVVQRMNQAQIEVLELQGQRDEAIKQTRSLQEKVVQENANMGGLMSRLGRK